VNPIGADFGGVSDGGKERGLGRGNDTSAIMAPAAHNLTQSQIAAIVASLSYLP